MKMIYENNEQLAIELKKLMLDCKLSQREIADRLEIKPQGLTKLMNKKNFGFNDAQKILNAMGYELDINFTEQKKDAQ
ncbi:helix-turn-helix transcriptional regulator [uncultured Thomasclavelia sp.]|uniref:helix-turn-helix domain-containing protein n=1 Tax=uncultured Thomasclavelia sp. TaxID=3025759 RepID=UPI00262305DE|nr:helix-turn-helix transcriptional regulator [uncultured Thomasclavelia sp.]